MDKLKGEGTGILNWALQGFNDWRKSGLQVPDAIRRSTAEYRDEQDIIGEWISERCLAGPDRSVSKGDLYADYQDWSKRNGHLPLAQGRLTRRLGERGYRVLPDKRTVGGLALRGPTLLSRNL